MIEEFYDMFPDVPSERLYFRLTDAEGRPCNGGEADPLPLNEWSKTIPNPRICARGWHATRDPEAWDGQRLWVVEVSDTNGGVEDDKVCASRIRPLCEVTYETTKNPRLLARIGVFTEEMNLKPIEAFLIGRQFGPHDVTRSIACQDNYYAYRYALEVDKGPRDDTRRAACRDAEAATRYAFHVDCGPRDDTREAACKDDMYAYSYARDVDCCPRDDTRKAACRDAKYALYYAYNVDKGPRPDTREAASRDPEWGSWYEAAFPVNDP